MMNELETGGQEWAKQFAGGFLVIGVISEIGVYPGQPCADPELTPRQMLTNAKYRIKARTSAVTDPQEGQLREEYPGSGSKRLVKWAGLSR